MCLCEWITHPARNKWWALLCGFMVLCNDCSKKGSLVGVDANLPMPMPFTQHPCEGRGKKRAKHVDRTFLSQSTFSGLFDPFVIVWGIRTTNLICWIIDFQCDPCRYSVLLLRPQTIWMKAPSLARSWKLPEHVWEQGGALAPGTSLRLEVMLLAACRRGQHPESESLSLLCLHLYG